MFLNNSMSNSGCGCSSRSGNMECQNFGPFLAIDAACLPPLQPTTEGSIIPFSSGITPVVLTSLVTGLIATPSLIGFGTAVPGVTLLGETLDLSGVVTEAFTVPRAGNITGLSASFSTTLAVTLIGSTTVTATIYRAPAGSTVYTATTATVNLAPPFTGVIALGTTAFGSGSFAPVPVTAGDKLVMVYSITTAGVAVAQVLTGTASAGITIQ
ncbi:exosporium glycoprotein BclB-related protein [Lysinibacillus sp. NPDC093210]|uniref:exosporium glycoprotein BclB-related protein n=1 Tax=Lysinibacillus sp. NPDC093210 TaxID=3364133 RepID=UPI0038248DA6